MMYWVLCVAVGYCLVIIGSAIPLNETADDGQLVVNNTRLVFGKESMLRTQSRVIWHMEPDLYLGEGHILFAWGGAIKTTDNNQVLDVVGSIDRWGYQEGQGPEAKFQRITNFLQISKEKVVIVDNYNGCLRELDRPTNLVYQYAGQCANRGYADGDSKTAQFYNIYDVLLDERTNKSLIVVDNVNAALRSVDLATRITTTIIQDFDTMMRPRFATFSNEDKNVLYVTVKWRVLRMSLLDNSLSVVVGSQIANQYLDGPIGSSLFGYLAAEIVQIDANHLAVADFWNHDVRIIDLVDQKVTSLCESQYNGTATDGLGCTLQNPHALMLLNDTLYVGDSSDVHMFLVASIPADETSWPEHLGRKCQPRTINTVLKDDKDRARIEINEETVLFLQAGHTQYVYEDQGLVCTVDINVKASPLSCPSSISRVASPDTMTAIVDLVLGNIHQQFVLPIGQHPYSVKIRDLNCNFNINVFDADLERRVVFQVEYKVDCARLAGSKAANDLVHSMIENNFVYLLELSDGVCGKKPGSKPTIVCSKDTMTATYLTDLSYGGDVTEIPADVKQTLTSRLINKGTMMSVVDMAKIPPVIFPVMQPNGASAKLVFVSSCHNQKSYDSVKDSCY